MWVERKNTALIDLGQMKLQRMLEITGKRINFGKQINEK